VYKSEVKHESGIYARVVADSIANGIRLTTMEVRFHRFCLPEFNTHRMFSRNFSSSRAIPVAKMIEQVENEPAIPVHWGKNQAGMQAREEHENIAACKQAWKMVSEWSVESATGLEKQGLHKQIVNRIIEPFQFVKGVVTATEWDNFFKLRDHEAAQPEIQVLAKCMKQAMDESEPDKLEIGDWHLPYVSDKEWVEAHSGCDEKYIKCSVARCARVSYMKHDNTSPSVEDDIELYNMLATRPYTDKRGAYSPENDPVHLSPLEHIATPMRNTRFDPTGDLCYWEDGASHCDRKGNMWSGTLKGYIQYRKLIEGEK